MASETRHSHSEMWEASPLRPRRSSCVVSAERGEGTTMSHDDLPRESQQTFTEPSEDARKTGLLQAGHEAILVSSGISREVMEARGYRSVISKAELARLGFAQSQ